MTIGGQDLSSSSNLRRKSPRSGGAMFGGTSGSWQVRVTAETAQNLEENRWKRHENASKNAMDSGLKSS